jgi:hypothetical protein
MSILFNTEEKSANINESKGFARNPRSAISEENNRNTLPEMVTQSLIQSKDLITSNNKQATESLDSAALCVGRFEGKKQRIGVRLSIAERQALENTAKENNMTLSNLICKVAQIFAHQKSA